MQLWTLYALLSAFFAALVGIFGKIGLGDIDTTLATTIRALIMAAFLAAASLLLGKFQLSETLGGRALTFVTLSGIAGALSWLFYFLALKLGPVSGVVALDRLSVVFVLVLAVLFLGERLSWQSLLGAACITLGAILMSY
jgi:transporter family protein